MVSFSGAFRQLGMGWLLSAALAGVAHGSPLAGRQSTDRMVFCHFMMGIVGSRSSADDYDADMINAKAAGIDAFALNIGTDDFTSDQLGYAYDSAAKNGMKVFISFDFNWFSTDDAATVGSMIQTYGSKDAQLLVDDRIFASSFAGDGLDVAAMKSAAGSDVYFVPNFHPEQSDASAIDGGFNWVVSSSRIRRNGRSSLHVL